MHVLTVIRAYLGLSQVVLAQACGITQADLSEIETKEPYGKIGKYQRISQHLGLPLEAIVKNDFTQIPQTFFEQHPVPTFTVPPSTPDSLMGRQGEDLIYAREQERLKQVWPALSMLVLPFYKMKGGSPGYDILSFDDLGKPFALEVKTSPKDKEVFRVTPNELEAAKRLTASGIPYIICYISNWGTQEQQIKEYSFESLAQSHRIDPFVYLCRPLPKPKPFPITGLAYFRRKRGLRQVDLAEAVGVPACDWNGYENGNRIPSVKIYLRASELLGATVDELVAQYDREAAHG